MKMEGSGSLRALGFCGNVGGFFCLLGFFRVFFICFLLFFLFWCPCILPVCLGAPYAFLMLFLFLPIKKKHIMIMERVS
jgi:hypothetical protein